MEANAPAAGGPPSLDFRVRKEGAMNTWFRLYNDVVHDPKVQDLSPKMFKFWINLLCLTSKHNGFLPPLTEISFALRLTEMKVQEGLDQLSLARLIDNTPQGLRPHGWDNRQFKSDGSTERVKRFRERSGNVTVTVNETGPEQNRTDTEQKRSDSITFGESDRWKDPDHWHRCEVCGPPAHGWSCDVSKTDCQTPYIAACLTSGKNDKGEMVTY
jgi:hypothetical protein